MMTNFKTLLLIALLSHTGWCCIGNGFEDPECSGEDCPDHTTPYIHENTAYVPGSTVETSSVSTETTTEGPTEAPTRDPNGLWARDPSHMTREACDKACQQNVYYRHGFVERGLVIDFNHPRYPKATKDPQNQDWPIGCLCFKHCPTKEIIQKRCETKLRKLDIGDFCSYIDSFADCVDEGTLEYWRIVCMYDFCPPKRSPKISVDYHLRDSSAWGPWCVVMEKLHQQCAEQKPDFEIPEWKTSDFCTE